MKKVWFVYILECADGTLYTGITNDLEKRIKAHNAGKGAKYTRGRGPVKLKFSYMRPSKSEALSYEAELKKDSREEKLKRIQYWNSEKNRTRLDEVINILKEEKWTTKWEVDKNDGNDNNSTYVIWKKDGATLYLGNYYLQGETVGAFPWADPFVTKNHILALLNGDKKAAYNY